MLSPHEFATLMLVCQAPDQLDMNRAELDALLERQLVMLEHRAPGRRRAYLTKKGRSILHALGADIAPRASRGATAERSGQYATPVALSDEVG
ncbi:hypothetical protein KDW20_32425 [Burkholderia cenocepacia]|uniref:hypothetical protein n=1 Tax=Burkholderia cenocepacia TaxID=95486 RepID=UPI001588EA07|nr:hypothetical protein [Burkholderia cenocepacia]MBR8380489.1 hypothetical protein [Burkholderia cenocepacia]MBR8415063.1 hypothetical protein [Burkholderia cenocepacia]MCA8238984.1 hypothetical protein [Burkholderia cenocepacia]MDS0849635.1 hypothetical protein [Burkholderia cenocepacia]